MNRLLFLFSVFCFALSSQAQTTGFIKTHQVTVGGGTQSFAYNGPLGSSFSLTDGQIQLSGPLTSNQLYDVIQTVPTGWSVTSISCVCYQSNAPGNDPTAPCQSTWTPDLNDASVRVNLQGQELVECTFVDTPTSCTDPSCGVRGEIDIQQISASGTSQSFTYQTTYPGSPFSLTDGQINSSGAIGSFMPYSITQTPVPTDWLVTNISCVCSQLDNSDAPCQSTWTPDISHSKVNITLLGAEKVTCTFVDTLNPCGTGKTTCPNPVCGNGVVETQTGEQCDNGIHNSDTTFGPGQCTARCTIAPLTGPTRCVANAIRLYNSCNQLPGRTSEVSVMLMILAALFWFSRLSVKRVK